MELGAITDEELFILFVRYDQEAIFYSLALLIIMILKMIPWELFCSIKLR